MNVEWEIRRLGEVVQDLKNKISNEAWTEYRMLVLSEIKRINALVTTLQEDHEKTKTNLAVLQGKAAVVAAIISTLTVLIISAIKN